MLKRRAGLPNREGAAFGHVGLVDSHALADTLGFRSYPSMEQEDWLCHVRAGEIYNGHVAHTNMRRYFTLAERDVLADEHGRYAEDSGELGYVVPGDEPAGQPGRSVYGAALDMVKSPSNAKQAVVRAYLMSYILTAGERAARDAKRR